MRYGRKLLISHSEVDTWQRCVVTGCEAGLPKAIGPPPPLRVGVTARDAMTLRDKPANDAGRNAMSPAALLIAMSDLQFAQPRLDVSQSQIS